MYMNYVVCSGSVQRERENGRVWLYSLRSLRYSECIATREKKKITSVKEKENNCLIFNILNKVSFSVSPKFTKSSHLILISDKIHNPAITLRVIQHAM